MFVWWDETVICGCVFTPCFWLSKAVTVEADLKRDVAYGFLVWPMVFRCILPMGLFFLDGAKGKMSNYKILDWNDFVSCSEWLCVKGLTFKLSSGLVLLFAEFWLLQFCINQIQLFCALACYSGLLWNRFWWQTSGLMIFWCL